MSDYRGAYVGLYVPVANLSNLKYITMMPAVLVLPTSLQKYKPKSNLIINNNNMVRFWFYFEKARLLPLFLILHA
jgi:hypothetical protein